MRMRSFMYIALALVVLATAMAAPIAAQILVVDTPLTNNTGVFFQNGGSFGPNGWTVDNRNNSLVFHVNPISSGAFEFDVKGIGNTASYGGAMSEDMQIFTMYDWTNGSDTSYTPWRNNPYKVVLSKDNFAGGANSDKLRPVYQVNSWYVAPYSEHYTSTLTWNSNTTYKIRVEWGPIINPAFANLPGGPYGAAGPGVSEMRIYRDGVLVSELASTYAWTPPRS